MTHEPFATLKLIKFLSCFDNGVRAKVPKVSFYIADAFVSSKESVNFAFDVAIMIYLCV